MPAGNCAIVAIVDSEFEAWFCREILPHEAALMRFLKHKCADVTAAEDLRHDVYVRILEAAEQRRPLLPKALLFKIARNLLIDRIRRDRVVAIDLMEDLDALNVLVDNLSPERCASGRQQLERVAKIFNRIPGKCREVLWMRRIDGMAQAEVARRLRITEAAVEKHVYRGMRFLADALYGEAARRDATDGREVESGNEYGD